MHGFLGVATVQKGGRGGQTKLKLLTTKGLASLSGVSQGPGLKLLEGSEGPMELGLEVLTPPINNSSWRSSHFAISQLNSKGLPGLVRQKLFDNGESDPRVAPVHGLLGLGCKPGSVSNS
eukprot:6009914-Lingulodinium_polyedra.AAC.1